MFSATDRCVCVSRSRALSLALALPLSRALSLSLFNTNGLFYAICSKCRRCVRSVICGSWSPANIDDNRKVGVVWLGWGGGVAAAAMS